MIAVPIGRPEAIAVTWPCPLSPWERIEVSSGLIP